MELSDKVKAVSRMQHYISTHLDEDITLDSLVNIAGYSKYYALRIFKELTGRTPFETIRALRLTKAAQTLQSSDKKIVDLAISSGFDSHDGFTRAFDRQFGITPQKYHVETPPVSWFFCVTTRLIISPLARKLAVTGRAFTTAFRKSLTPLQEVVCRNS